MRGLFIFIVLILAGCASKLPPSKDYKKYDSPIYPSISVTVNDGYVDSSTSCYQYGCYDYVDETSAFLVKELRDADMFKSVQVNNTYEPYKIYANIQRETRGSEAAHLSKGMIMAGSLLIIPVVFTYTYHADFSVYHESELLEDFHYSLDADEVPNLLKSPQDDKKKVIASIVSHFLDDLERTEVLLSQLENPDSTPVNTD